jgi:hypothetical protein
VSQTMNIDGWDIPLDSLPGRLPEDQRSWHQLFENPTGDLAAVLYCINEYRYGTEIGRLAIFRNKSLPERIIASEDVWWHANPLSLPVKWISDASFTINTACAREMPVILMDVVDYRFCFLHVPRGDLYNVDLDNGFVSLSPITTADVALKVRSFSCAEMFWFSLDRFADFHKTYIESAAHHGISTKAWHRHWVARVADLVCFPFFWLIFWPVLLFDFARRKTKG